MADKTQIATVALAAQYSAPVLVIAGTTLGMLIADIPAVFVGGRLGEKLPLKVIRTVAALLFVALGVAALATPFLELPLPNGYNPPLSDEQDKSRRIWLSTMQPRRRSLLIISAPRATPGRPKSRSRF